MTSGCPRCEEREAAQHGSEAEQVAFRNSEAERLSRIDGFPAWDDLPEAPLPIHVALVGGGLPVSVALVSCGKAKLATREKVPAHSLYIGNPFRMSLRHALATSDDVLILSALHGLVHPYEMLAHYDFTMTQMKTSERRVWGQSVVHALRAQYPLRNLKLIFYAGRDYVEPIVESFTPEDLQYWSYEDPLKGMGLFARLAWFKAREPIIIATEPA